MPGAEGARRRSTNHDTTSDNKPNTKLMRSVAMQQPPFARAAAQRSPDLVLV